MSFDIYTYKYKNEMDPSADVASIPKVTIEQEDLEEVGGDNAMQVLGNRIGETTTYVDKEGILRNYDGTSKIMKVALADVPVDNGNNANNNNQLNQTANNVLRDMAALLEQLNAFLPDYMRVSWNNKEYIISKQIPYIIV
jgi:hypothetical protein